MIEDFYKEFSNDIALDAGAQAIFFPVVFVSITKKVLV